MDTVSIMLVEDHLLLRESIRNILLQSERFCSITEAGDGQEAIDKACQVKPDVILMDISLPKINGIEATKRIKLMMPSVAILVLTAYDYEQYIFPVLQAGASGYLLKDVSSEELLNSINIVHQGGCVLHPAITKKVLDRIRVQPEAPIRHCRSQFTGREYTILKMAAKGMNNLDIAKELYLSIRTVETHLRSVYNKLGVTSRTEAVFQALQQGLLDMNELSEERR